MSSISSVSDQLHLLDNNEDLRLHASQLISAGQRDMRLFSRKLNPAFFNRTTFVDTLSLVVRQSRLFCAKIIICEPKIIVEDNHKLLKLSHRLTSKIHIRRLTIEPEQEAEFMIVDRDKLWLQHKEYEHTGFADYDTPARAKQMTTLFEEYWKQSVADPALQQMVL